MFIKFFKNLDNVKYRFLKIKSVEQSVKLGIGSLSNGNGSISNI